MSKYIFIESRDPFESRDSSFVRETASALHQHGHEVTVFMVQNGVLATRKEAQEIWLSQLASTGITLLADDFSLSERGIQPAELQPGISPAPIEVQVDLLVQENTKAIWH